MKKFLAVALAATVIVLSAVPAFAVTKVPISSITSVDIVTMKPVNYLLQFDVGNDNYVVPIDSTYNASYYKNFFNFYNSGSLMVVSFYSSDSITVSFGPTGSSLKYTSTSSTSSYFSYSNSSTFTSFSLSYDRSSGYYKITNISTGGVSVRLANWNNMKASYVRGYSSDLMYAYILDVSSFSFVDSASYVPPGSSTHTLTVNYLYSQDNPAADPVTQELSSGEEYSIPSPQIGGYTPSIPLVTGTMPDEDLTIDVYYTKSFYPLTVKYQYQDGSKAADDVTQQYPFGFTYDIPSPEIDGHSPDRSSVSGIMPDGPLSEVVTYTPNSYNLRIDYLHLDGSQAAESYFQELPFGTKYAVPSPQLEGYHPNQSMITGTMRSHNVSYTVTYRPDSGGGSSGGGGADPDDGGGGGSGDGGGGDYGGDDPFEGVDPPDFSGDDPFTGVNPPDFTGNDPFSGISSPEFSGFDPFKMPSSFDNVKTDFLAFSPAYLYEMVGNLRENIGSISSVAFYAFFVILSIYLIRNIIDNIIR